MNFASLSHEELLQRVREAPMEAALQEKAMEEICRRTNLGKNEAAVAALFQLGVLPLIVAALKNHAGNEDVALYASDALWCVVRESPERRAAAVAAGAVGPLLQALRRWRRLVFAEALGVLCLTEPAAREEALRGGALQLLRQLWEEKPLGRNDFAFCAFAMAQGEGNEFIKLAGQLQWVVKHLEQYKGNISSDYPTLKTDVQKLVDLCREVQSTGHYPASPSAEQLAPVKVKATGGYPAKSPAVAAGKAAAPPVPPAVATAVVKGKPTSAHPAHPAGPTFAGSHFKALYKASKAPTLPTRFCSIFVDWLESLGFEDAQTTAIELKVTEKIQEKFTVAELATFIWSLNETVGGRELCSYMNQIVREDDREKLERMMPLIRSINQNLVTRHGDPNRWPEGNITYRGAGIPADQIEFFSTGKHYRCPMFLATSFKEEVALDFMRRMAKGGKEMMMFRVHYDPDRRCDHVNYIARSSALAHEDEFLFPPYSVFMVKTNPKKEGGKWVVDIEAFYDNLEAPEDLPSSPWH